MSDVVRSQRSGGVVRNALMGHSELPAAKIFTYLNSVLRTELMAQMRVRGTEGVVEVCRYGALGHVMAALPVVVYDHPAMVRAFPTAFTDGARIYVSAAFAYAMLADDAANEHHTSTMALVLLHEASHVAFAHTLGRLEGAAPPQTLNFIFDAVVNPRLLTAFPDLVPGAPVQAWVATSAQAVAFFKDMSEEEALALYLKDPVTFARRSGAPAVTPDEIHFTTTREFSEWLERHGLEAIRDAMGLPPAADTDAHRQLTDTLKARMNEAAERTAREISEARRAGAALPGGHLNEAFVDQVRLVNRPRLRFEAHLRRALQALGGQRFAQTDELPDDLRYTRAATMGFAMNPWLPGHAPVARTAMKVLVFVDTSSSLNNLELSECFTEVFSMARQLGRRDVEIVVQCADTDLRGKPLRISPANLQPVLREHASHVKATGRGGTNIEACLRSAAHRYRREIAGNQVAAILYFTDTEDDPPARDALPLKFPRTSFICPESCYRTEFAQAVAAWADTICIRDDQIVRIQYGETPDLCMR